MPPEVLFGRMRSKLPNISKMYDRGLHGTLRSCNPPITVPAWAVLFTGKSPGSLGVYGFRHRKPGSYTEGYIVNSGHIREKQVWETIGEKGLKSIVIGMPPGYPPKPSPNSAIVSCFLTPTAERPFSSPPELKKEILDLTGGAYQFDVVFRTEDRAELRKNLFEMTEKRFDVAEHFARTRPWDFFALHEIGFDRLHHAFWKYYDVTHPKYVPGNEFESVFDDYYSMADRRIGALLEIFGDDCVTLVASDHGSKGMKGAFCINEWLASEGYLHYKNPPATVTEIEKADVDWTRTRAWGWGGYYARIFFNVKGREGTGTVERADLDRAKKELKTKIESIRDPTGRVMRNVVFEPAQVYPEVNGDAPDLMVYFDDLDWRSAGTVGHRSLYLSENDTGPDDSVHSMEGVLIMYNPRKDLGGRELSNLRLQDIGPTILEAFGYPLRQEPGLGSPVEALVEGAKP